VRNGWQIKTLGDLFDITSSKRVFEADWKTEGVPFYRAREIVKLARQGLVDNELFISEEMFNRYSTKYGIPAEGDTMVTGVGTLGICYVVNKGDRFYFKDGNIIWLKKKTEAYSRFVEYAFQSDFLRSQIDNSVGATVGTYTIIKAKSTRIPVPPLPEQKRIVAILDEAFEGISTAVTNSEKNLANARELFENATVTSLFGDPVIQGWRLTSVENIAAGGKGNIRTGPFGSQILHGEFVDEGIAVLGIDNAVDNEFRWAKRRFITLEKYAELSRYTVKPGDVLITIMGTCGRCAIVPDDIPLAINSKHLCCITLDREQCLPDFLHAYFLYHPVARSFLATRAKGSIMEGLNMGIIKKLPVWLPDLQAQTTIVYKMELLRAKVLRIQAIYEKKLQILSELKESILEKAFAGELTAQPDKALQEAAAA
jgi:type I restriction enzyme, S subunit